jgi:nucleotidyltransferase/DNA polymerase involved in DNA repair
VPSDHCSEATASGDLAEVGKLPLHRHCPAVGSRLLAPGPDVGSHGLDEAYLDMTENRLGLPTASVTAKAIRARILEETGLTASAGVSYNKFLAKLASSQRKPNGQFVITPEMGPDFVASLPVGKFHGVGPVTAAKMQSPRIETGAESESEVARLPAAAFREIGRVVSQHRTRRR